MSARAARRLAWVLWALLMAVLAFVVVSGPSDQDVWGLAGGVAFIVVFATTGALVTPRVPRNPIGWLLCLAAVAFTVGGTCELIVERAGAAGEPGLSVALVAWLGSFIWIVGFGPAATYVLLLFPDGRLPSQRWRPVAWATGAALAASITGSAVAPGPVEGTDIDNPFGLDPALAGVARALEGGGLVLFLGCILLSCASLVARYRSVGQEQRQQLKWLAWSVPVVLTWLLASVVVGFAFEGDTAVDVANALSSVGLAVVPIAISVAVLRHRLYDIDVVIKRTLVYGTLTAILLATYLALVLTLQPLLRPVAGDSSLAVAASTLAVAALFRPLRSALQRGVDRRFFRSRYDAARTLDEFSGRLRHDLDLDSLGTDLRSVIHDTMQPAHVSLWLRRES